MSGNCYWCRKSTAGRLWLTGEIFVCTYCYCERRTLSTSMRDEDELYDLDLVA